MKCKKCGASVSLKDAKGSGADSASDSVSCPSCGALLSLEGKRHGCGCWLLGLLLVVLLLGLLVPLFPYFSYLKLSPVNVDVKKVETR